MYSAPAPPWNEVPISVWVQPAGTSLTIDEGLIYVDTQGSGMCASVR